MATHDKNQDKNSINIKPKWIQWVLLKILWLVALPVHGPMLLKYTTQNMTSHIFKEHDHRRVQKKTEQEKKIEHIWIFRQGVY